MGRLAKRICCRVRVRRCVAKRKEKKKLTREKEKGGRVGRSRSSSGILVEGSEKRDQFEEGGGKRKGHLGTIRMVQRNDPVRKKRVNQNA